MHIFSSALAASAVALLASASPVHQARSAGFSINQVAGDPLPNGPVALLAALTRYNAPVPNNVQAAAANGNVTATPETYDSEYLCPVTIGNQTLNLDFDTGSADLWVFSSQTPASERAGHNYYTPDSTAKKLPGYTWNISYGDGSSSSGDVYTDNVNIGGAIVTSQAIELAEQVSAEFVNDKKSSGLVGLASSSINTVSPKKQTTFFDTAINEGVLTSPVFTANLKKGAPGTYDFGYIDSTQYTGSLHCATVNNANGYWQFSASGYQVGSNAFKATTLSVIADTGTSIMLLADSLVTAYYSKVSGAEYSNNDGGYIFPCSNTLPSFTIGIGTWHSAVVPGTYLNYASVGNGYCYGAIQSNSGIGFNILGDTFLKAFFVVFNKGTNQVCVATKTL